MKLLYVRYDGNRLSVHHTDPSTLFSTEISSVDVGPAPLRSGDNVIAYIPSYSDLDESLLGTGFLNLEVIFSCIANHGVSKVPRCSKNTFGEDGLNQGNPVVSIADRGIKLEIFGEKISTYAFAVPKCTDFTAASDGCLRDKYDFGLVCYLPRFHCGNAN